jgi:hypothetical protein
MRLDNQFWSCSFCLPACQQLIDTLHWTIDDNYTVLLQRLKKGKNKQNGQHFLGWKKNATAVKDRGRFWHRWVRWSARLNPSPINPNYVNQPPSFFAYSSHVDTHEKNSDPSSFNSWYQQDFSWYKIQCSYPHSFNHQPPPRSVAKPGNVCVFFF